MNTLFDHQLLQTRRQFFGSNGLRMGGMAMAALAGQSLLNHSASRGFAEQLSGRVHPPLPGLPHFAAKGKIDHLSAHERWPLADRHVGL